MDRIPRTVSPMFTAALVSLLSASALGQAACCSHCGSTIGLRKTCRPVPTARPVETDCWDVVEEEIAVPRPRGVLACNCGSLFGSCCSTGECGVYMSGGCQACCKVRPRNRLVRKTFLEEVPVVVWVVEYTCAKCAAGDGHGNAHPVPAALPLPAISTAGPPPAQDVLVQPPRPHAERNAPLPTPPESVPVQISDGGPQNVRPEMSSLHELMRTLHEAGLQE